MAELKCYEFDVSLRLPARHPDPESYVDQLFEAGCDDALPGIGLHGFIALGFHREATDAETAMETALSDARRGIPGAELVEIEPDIVSLSELADMYDCSRQNMRKRLLENPDAPVPLHMGSPILWHLAEVAPFLNARVSKPLDETIVEVARVAQRLNAASRARRTERVPAG